MVTFDDLQRVNATIKTTDIRGKQYAEVNQRIKAFRQLYPEGFITTEIISLEGGVIVMRATVGHNTDRGAEILGTGTAYEKENSTQINKTSYIENCETSAIGRALAACGYGIDTSIASAEEVENAITQQEEAAAGNKKASPAMIAGLVREANENGLTIEDICELCKVETAEEITVAKLQNIRTNWKRAQQWKAEKNAGTGNN